MLPPKGTLTDPADLTAYVVAHAAGYVSGMTINPMIFRSLLAQGYHEHLFLVIIALGITTSAVVLLIFLLLRKLIAGASAAPPPPADKPAPPPGFTDLPEIGAYVIAHGAGIIWNMTVTPLIFRSLVAQGHRNLQFAGLALGITVSIVVLLLFLFLRKAMRGAATRT
jgi:hypothetical protein